MAILTFLFAHKLIVVLIVAVAAFVTSTIVLGVINSDLHQELDEINSETTLPTTTTTEKPIDMSKYRLPKSVSPVSYDLYLYPYLDTGLFKGKVIAASKVLETTDNIVLNTHLLNINQVTVDNVEAEFSIDQFFEQLSIRKKDGSNFAVGDVNIDIEFDGDMKNRIVGLYRSSYSNSAGDQRYMATSKFEPTYARQAFPCFDEPNMKAKYKVHLLKPADSDYIALSNYPQINEETVPEGVMVHFNETVPMSTYLSCFIVSDFKHTTTSFNNGETTIPFKVFASPEQLDKTTYAGQVGKKVIEFYVNYFNIPYPLPKLDMVAIPDFVSGAMEHWGLVTYRETALLYTNETHSSSNKQRVATVVAHELAHSWFGNLVTMDWWDNLWLNEGFATYIEFKGVLDAEPTWGMLDQFLTSELHPVLALDATQGSHPIIQTVTTPDQITEVFDTISYNKGASVLRMLEDVVGETNFQQGVTNYLKAHDFGNAITQDLWDEVQKVVGDKMNVTEFMNTFTIQMGLPILTATVSGNKYTFTQKRFLIDPESASKGKSSPLNYKWSVPITYVTDLNPTKSEIVWFNFKDTSVSIDKPTGAKWIKLNPKQIGYYRVNYPENEWQTLISVINELSVSDRTHLLEETFSIAESGDLSYGIPLDLTKYLVKELDYVPWSVASSKLQTISSYLEDSQYASKFREYVIGLLKPAYENLTWATQTEDDHLTKLARVTVLSLACALEYEDALNQAKDLFSKFINDKTPVDQDLRATVYKYGMFSADEDTWDKLFEIFTNETDANEKLKFMNGLASVQNIRLLARLIDLAKDETYVRGQDYFTLLQYISANPIGRSIVWDYVREHWQELVDRFTLNNRYLGSLIPAITTKFTTNIKLDEMKRFFEVNSEAGAGAANRLRAVENVQNNINWLKKYKTAVEAWISENVNN